MGKRTNTAAWIEKSRRWQIKVQKDGIRKTFYSSKPGRAGQREANAKADAWLDEGIDNTSARVNRLLDEYLLMKQQTTSKNNLRKETYHVSFIRQVIGAKKISAVTERDFQDIIDKAFRHKNADDETIELSRKTLQNIRATLNAFLKFCRQKRVTTLHLESVAIPQAARLKGVRILQPDDLIKLFTCDTTTLYNSTRFDEYIYAYRFAVLTGLRPGELRALRWQDIDGYRISVKGAINSENEHTRGKNENAIRGFVISELARFTLNQQRELCPDSDAVFFIPSITTYRHRWTRYCEANGIEHTTLYALRHTFVSIIKTLPEGEVKALVGHSRSMDTLGTYRHEIAGEGIKTANDVNDIFAALLRSQIA